MRKAVVTLAMIGALAGCVKPEPATQATFVPVGAVSVGLAEGASFGLLKQSQDPALAQAFTSQLKSELTSDLVSKGTGNTATVLVDRLTIQSGAGRAIAAAESFVSGDVVVRDRSGRVVATLQDVEFANAAQRNTSTFNGIPIGALISMANNAKEADAEAQVSALAEGFSRTIATRLGR